MRRVPIPAVAALASAALAFAGCGDDSERGGSNGKVAGGSSAKPTATVNVSETEYKLTPASTKIARTGVTAFEATNDGKIEHALEVEGPSEERETKPIAAGKSATLRVDLSKPGRYEWYCPIADHKDRGMRGEIVVAGGGSKGKAEDKPESDDKPKGGSSDDDGGGAGY